jgi:hypothetical protein
MFGRGPAARIAVVSVSELSPCPGRAAIEQLAPVYACVIGVCLQLAAYAAWWSCMESVAIRRELQARPARWCVSWRRLKLADRAAEWGSVSSCSRSPVLAIKTPCTHRCCIGQEKYIRQRVCAAVFGHNSCPTKSRRSIPARADGRSHQEPMVDPNSEDALYHFLIAQDAFVRVR